jgi:hypothetical protein
VTRLRTLLFARRWFALAIVVAALAVRLVVPAGMMPGFGPDGATLTICTGHGAVGVPGAKPDAAKADAPCAFTGLFAAALDAAALPALPALPLPVAMPAAAVLIAVAGRSRRLRPPLRGPPALVAA